MNGLGELKSTSAHPNLKSAPNPTHSHSDVLLNHSHLPIHLIDLIDALNPNLHSNQIPLLDSDSDPDSDSELNLILSSIDQLLLCESGKIDSELELQQPFLVWNRFSQAIQFYAQNHLHQFPPPHLPHLQDDLQDNPKDNSEPRAQKYLINLAQPNPQTHFEIHLQNSPHLQRPFSLTRLKLNLLNACIHSYSQNKPQVDNLPTLCFYRDLYDLLNNHPPPSLLNSPAQNYQAIINSINSLDLLTNHGKQIVGCQGIVNLLINIIKPAIDLQLEINSSASFFRLLNPTPVALILNHAAELLTQITKFSSPQLTTPQVKQIINLFINQIGLSTRSEHALKIVLDYIDCLIVFGYVPNPNSSINHPPPSPTPAEELDGERLLIDLVRFVVKIVGLQDVEAIVDEIGPEGSLTELDRPAAANHSNSHPDAVRLVVTKTTPLSPAIVERAKTCMKDLIRSPSNQAIKSLLSTLTITDASINEWSKIGAIRCLRFAYEDYDYVSTQARPASSLDDNVSAIERSLTLLGLGLLLVKSPLQAIIASPDRTTLAIDYEILMLLTDRLEMCLKTSKPAGMISLMKQDDLECCLDLMLLFAQERLKVWLEDREVGVVEWCLHFDTSFNAPPIQKDDHRQQAESKRSPLIAFANMFSLLFTYHGAEIQGRGTEKRGQLMCWNPICLDKYFSLCIKMSKYMSSSLKLSLVDQIDFDQVCSPECASWLSHLRALVDGFFHFGIPTINATFVTAKPGPTGSSESFKLPDAQFQIRLLRLISDVFMEIRDLELWREELLQVVIIPILSHILLLPRLPPFDDLALVDQAMDFMREIVHNEFVNDLLASQDHHEHLPNRPLATCDVIRRLLLVTAKMGQLIEVEDVNERVKQSSFNQDPYLLTPSELAPNPSTTIIVTPSTVPLKASTTTSTTISTTLYSPARPSSEPSRAPQKQDNLFSKRQHELSYKAVVTLIKLFMDGLQISTAYSNAKCAAIFVDLLDLLRSANDPGAVASASTSIRLNDFDHDLQRKVEHSQLGSRAKLAILKCLVRLRADEEHRVQFVRDLEIDGLAGIIGRLADPLDSRSNAQPMVSVPNHETRNMFSSPDRKPNLSPVTPASKPRTFSQSQRPPKRASVDEQINASRKVTPISTPVMQPAGLRSPTKLSEFLEEKMLWTAPEKLGEFGWAAKIETESTHSLVTYDHIARKEVDSAPERPQKGNLAHHSDHHMTVLPVAEYMAVVIGILRYEAEWELVSYVLCHLPGQLSNKHFACEPRASQQIHQLRRLLCSGIKTDTLLHQVRFPPGQRVKLTDAHAVSYQTLSTLIAYKALFDKAQADEMVGAFVKGLSRYKDTAKACIHALALACHELQPSMTKFLPEVLRGLTKIVSSASVSVHILELLGFLGQIPALYANLTEEEYKMVFGIALQYITSHNQQQQREEAWSQGATPPRSAQAEPSRIIEEVEQAFQQYVYLMAFYTIALWFVSLKLPERKKYVSFIVRKLVQACEGQAALDEPTEVCFDMLNRYTYANAEPKPRKKHSKFNELIKSSLGKPIRTASWVVGNAILTISCLSRPGWTEVCVKRPSGLVKMIWELENLSGDHVASEQDVLEMVIRHRDTLFSAASDDGMADDQVRVGEPGDSAGPDGMAGKAREVTLESVLSQSEEITRTTGIEPNFTNLQVEPSFFALQVLPFSDGPSRQADGRPMRVPDQPPFQRAVEMIDYLPVVDFHKIGVIYVGPGQSTEAEILGNREGSKAYINFLSGIGQLIRLKGCEHYNTGGLDTREDSNGRFAYMWGDDITQICFHIATLMPTSREEQPTGPDPILAKKALIGNDFVVIVFNDSGKEYKFDCLASQFNFINILVEPNTPINANWNLRAGVQQELKFYKISLQRKEGLPKIGPIENFKMISSSCLSEFVRRLALHANTFVQVYLGCVGTETVGRGVDSGGPGEPGAARRKVEYVSNWRARLREIRRLKDRLEKLRRTEEEQGKVDDEGEGGPESRARLGMQGPMKGRVSGGGGGEENGGPGGGGAIDLEGLARDRDFTSWAT